MRRLYYTDTPDRTRLEAFESWRPSEGTDTIVFDFRGCPGGDDGYIGNWIEGVVDRDVPLGVIVRRTGPGRLIDEWNQLAAFAADAGWDEARRVAARHPDHFTMVDASLPIRDQLAAVREARQWPGASAVAHARHGVDAVVHRG